MRERIVFHAQSLYFSLSYECTQKLMSASSWRWLKFVEYGEISRSKLPFYKYSYIPRQINKTEFIKQGAQI